MKARLYLTGYIDVEVPQTLAQGLAVRNGLVGPPDPSDDQQAFGAVVLIWLLDVLDQTSRERYNLEPSTWSTVCRVCGCTDEEACAGGCSWVEPDLCTRCLLVAEPMS